MDLDLNHLHQMDWKSFEILCRDFYTAKGYQARLTDTGADGGVDVIFTKVDLAGNAEKTYIQCKAFSNKNISVNYIRELYGVMAADGVKSGILITTTDFTDDAKKFAEGKQLELISGTKFLLLFDEISERDRQRIVEKILTDDYDVPTCPSCDIKMVLRQSKAKPFWGCKNYPKCHQTFHPKKSYEALEGNQSKLDETFSFLRGIADNIPFDVSEKAQIRIEKKVRKFIRRLIRKVLIIFFVFVASLTLLTCSVSSIFTILEPKPKNELVQKQTSGANQNNKISKENPPRVTTKIRSAPVKPKVEQAPKGKAVTERGHDPKLQQLLLEQRRKREQERDKNKAWLEWYNEPVGCDNWQSESHMVECSNHKRRARVVFDRLWSEGKIPTKAK